MTDPKKPSNEESILERIASSIEKIEKIDADNGSEESNENKKNSEENKVNDGFSISSNTDEFLTDDSKRKFPFLPTIGSIIGVVLVLLGIVLMLGTSDRVVDSVASGETGTISIFIIFLGVIILGLSILKFISRKELISEAFDNFHDLQLLDEYDEKNMNEDKKDSSIDTKLIDIDQEDDLDDNDLAADIHNDFDFNINNEEYVENTDFSLITDFYGTDFENIDISEDIDSREDIS